MCIVDVIKLTFVCFWTELRQVVGRQKYHPLENLQAIYSLVCGIHVTGVYLYSISLR